MQLPPCQYWLWSHCWKYDRRLTSGVRDDKSSDGMTSCSPFLIARSSLSTQPIITLVAYNLQKITIMKNLHQFYFTNLPCLHETYTRLQGYLHHIQLRSWEETDIVRVNVSSLHWPGACFSKGPETFRVRKAIFSWSFSKNREVHTPETSCMKRTSVHIKNTWIKQLCNQKVWDFAKAFRVRKLFGTFEKRAPGHGQDTNHMY